MGIQWYDQFFFDRVLPLGLWSSPYLFNCFADAIQWILQNEFSISDIMHYLDDYLNVSDPSLPLATHQLEIILQVFAYLGIPIATDRLKGPTQVLVFLGIILDTIRMEARLPDDKLAELKHLVSNFLAHNHTTVHALDSFMGKLSFAAQVVVAGRTFTRWLWDLYHKFERGAPFFRINLTSECKKDLTWWLHLLDQWNGKSFFLFEEPTPDHNLELFTDASGSTGWGAYYGLEKRWIQGTWHAEQQQENITYKVLYTIITACNTWGNRWTRHRVLIHGDNEAVVACVNTGTSHNQSVMSLLRSLFLICARNNCMVVTCHVPGSSNSIADALSRSLLQVFRRLVPTAREHPDRVPPIPPVD